MPNLGHTTCKAIPITHDRFDSFVQSLDKPTMAGVLCIWATDLPESSEQWYEDEYIPEMLSRHSARALLAETIETPLDKEFEGVGTRDAACKSLAVYEIEEVQKIIDATYDESNHPVMDGPLQGTRFDVRPYELIKSWQSDEEWNGSRSSPWTPAAFLCV